MGRSHTLKDDQAYLTLPSIKYIYSREKEIIQYIIRNIITNIYIPITYKIIFRNPLICRYILDVTIIQNFRGSNIFISKKRGPPKIPRAHLGVGPS